MSITIEKFIQNFENQFNDILGTPPQWSIKEGRLAPRYTNHFVVGSAEKKYSDWDLECCLKDTATQKTVKGIVSFVRNYCGLTNIGLLLTSNISISRWHNIDKCTALPFMGFMATEVEKPFFDLHVQNVDNKIVKQLYKTENEILTWLMLTAWRKLKMNGNVFEQFIKHYPCSFPQLYEGKKKAEEFYKMRFFDPSYTSIVRFLAS